MVDWLSGRLQALPAKTASQHKLLQKHTVMLSRPNQIVFEVRKELLFDYF